MESVASMDETDRNSMSVAFGDEPLQCNAGTLTCCQRPRLYWLSWEVVPDEPCYLRRNADGKPRSWCCEGHAGLRTSTAIWTDKVSARHPVANVHDLPAAVLAWQKTSGTQAV